MLYGTQNPHGGDVYGEEVILDFSANTNPYGTPESVLHAIREVLPQVHRYPDPYCRRLTQAIAEFEGVPQAYILCGNGAADIIYAYCEALRPKLALELAPTFSEYSLGLNRVGCRVERYYLTQEKGFSLDDGFLTCLTRMQPEVVILCSPNNPTGRPISPALLEKILVICKEKSIRLFLDECFLDLSHQGKSMKPFLAEYPGLFLLKAFTKSYGMAGIRLGYCMSSDGGLLEAMARTTQPWNVSTLAQAAGVAALGEQAFLEKTRALIARERPWLREALEGLGFWVCPSCANYLLFRGPVGLHEKLKRKQIAIRNCDNYPGLGPGWYRVAVRLHEENEMLIETIGEVL